MTGARLTIPQDAHDPGAGAARARAEATELPVPARLRIPGGGGIAVGTASWTDPTLTAPGVFYPPEATTPEARLRHYASRFPMVEVDSTYYAIPSPRMAELWAGRTPADFTFNIKAHALMTGHPTEVKRLPPPLREALPARLATAERVYARDLPEELVDEVWRSFTGALGPLREAGKLGALLLQYPRWFAATRASAAELERARDRLQGYAAAVEFRSAGWLAPRLRERTLLLLEKHDFTYVIVDEPQGMPSSVPPVVAVTSPKLAIFRMHGRRADTWEKRIHPVSEKYRYLYDRDELAAWVEPILDTALRAEQVHVVFNNCYANYGTSNAAEIAELLIGAEAARRSRGA